MIGRPANNRSQLNWHKFEETKSGEWMLCFPLYYAGLFEEVEGSLSEKSMTGWKDTRKGNNKIIFFNDLRKIDIDRINKFIHDFKHYVLINLNRNIQPHFSDELDYCEVNPIV